MSLFHKGSFSSSVFVFEQTRSTKGKVRAKHRGYARFFPYFYLTLHANLLNWREVRERYDV